jgi:hypothetical protein
MFCPVSIMSREISWNSLLCIKYEHLNTLVCHKCKYDITVLYISVYESVHKRIAEYNFQDLRAYLNPLDN